MYKVNKKDEKFIDLCLSGDVLTEEIDDFVDKWHESDSDESLEDFLGLTAREYELWVKNPKFLDYIVYLRKNKGILDSYSASIISDSSSKVAARGSAESDVIVQWLRETGRI
jgi:hypothetical protein